MEILFPCQLPVNNARHRLVNWDRFPPGSPLTSSSSVSPSPTHKKKTKKEDQVMHKQAKQSKQAKIKNALRVEKFVAICQDKVGCFVPNIQCFAIYKCLEIWEENMCVKFPELLGKIILVLRYGRRSMYMNIFRWKYCSHKTRITRTWKNTFLSRYSSNFRRLYFPLQDDIFTTVGYSGGWKDWGFYSEVRDDILLLEFSFPSVCPSVRSFVPIFYMHRT